MIEDYLLPRPISEKLKERFTRSTLRVGDSVNLSGFLVNPSFSKEMRVALWDKLSPVIGDFRVLGLTPFPQEGFPVMPVILPKGIGARSRAVEITGDVHELSQFSKYSGRFILVNKLIPRRAEDFLILAKTGLDGGKIMRMFSDAFHGAARESMLLYFLSSSKYSSRVGGCALSLVQLSDEDYGGTEGFKAVVRKIHPALRRSRIKLELNYDGIVESEVRVNLPIKYQELKPKKALEFYGERRGKEWEKSAMTDIIGGLEDLIGLSEVSLIPYREESYVLDDEIKEYSLDIATYALEKHIEMPPMDYDYAERFKERFLSKVESDLPLLSEAMRYGVIMDLSDVNGFGEHIARIVNSFQRLSRGNPEEMALEFTVETLARVEDAYQDIFRKRIASIGERERFERALNRILWELNTLKPEGWDFFYFQKKVDERGLNRDAEKILRELVDRGYVRILPGDRFLAVSSII